MNNKISIQCTKRKTIGIEEDFLTKWARVVDKESPRAALCYMVLHLEEFQGEVEIKSLAKVLGVGSINIKGILKTLYKNRLLSYEESSGNIRVQLYELPLDEEKKEETVQINPEPLWKQDPIELWSANHFFYYWSDLYKENVGTSYTKMTAKENSHFKRMYDEFGRKALKEAIYEFVRFSERYIGGPPTVSALYGFRRTVFPQFTGGKVGRSDQWKEKEVEKFKDKNTKAGRVW